HDPSRLRVRFCRPGHGQQPDQAHHRYALEGAEWQARGVLLRRRILSLLRGPALAAHHRHVALRHVLGAADNDLVVDRRVPEHPPARHGVLQLRDPEPRKEPEVVPRLRLIAILVSLAGVAVSIYLTVVHYAGFVPACPVSAAISCEAVLSSPYAVIAGTSIPT